MPLNSAYYKHGLTLPDLLKRVRSVHAYNMHYSEASEFFRDPGCKVTNKLVMQQLRGKLEKWGAE